MPISLLKLTFKSKSNYNNIVTELNSYKVIHNQTPNPICLILSVLFNIISFA